MNKPSVQQVNFINTLQFERKVPETLIDLMRQMWNAGVFTEESANDYIKTLIELPVDEEKQARNQSLVGYHSLRGHVYRVYRSKNGHMYVKRFMVDENGKAKMVFAKFGALAHFNENTRLHKVAIKNIEAMLRRH